MDDIQERDYIVVTDLAGNILRTMEIRKGVITHEDVSNDVFADTDVTEVVVVDVLPDEMESVRRNNRLPNRARLQVEEKVRTGKAVNRVRR